MPSPQLPCVFTCPRCSAILPEVASEVAVCAACGSSYEIHNGIYRFLLPGRLDELQPSFKHIARSVNRTAIGPEHQLNTIQWPGRMHTARTPEPSRCGRKALPTSAVFCPRSSGTGCSFWILGTDRARATISRPLRAERHYSTRCRISDEDHDERCGSSGRFIGPIRSVTRPSRLGRSAALSWPPATA